MGWQPRSSKAVSIAWVRGMLFLGNAERPAHLIERDVVESRIDASVVGIPSRVDVAESKNSFI